MKLKNLVITYICRVIILVMLIAMLPASHTPIQAAEVIRYFSLEMQSGTATVSGAASGVTGTSSDSSVATYSGGLLRAHSEGATEVRIAGSGNTVIVCRVSVYAKYPQPKTAVVKNRPNGVKLSQWGRQNNTNYTGDELSTSENVTVLWRCDDSTTGNQMMYVKSGSKEGYVSNSEITDRPIDVAYFQDMKPGEAKYLGTVISGVYFEDQVWSSTNTGVATVSSVTYNGNKQQGRVIGVVAGTTRITATSSSGNEKTTALITVYSEYSPSRAAKITNETPIFNGATTGARAVATYNTGRNITVTGESGSYYRISENRYVAKSAVSFPVSTVAVSASKTTINVTEMLQCTTTIAPSYATNKTVAWSSSNPAVATVNTSSGVVTGVSNGTTNIIAKSADGGITGQITITVRTPVLGVTVDPTYTEFRIGETATITSTVLPGTASNQNVTWQSSNYAIASVDGNGVVTGHSVGDVTITAITENPVITATAQVKVKPILVESVEIEPTELEMITGETGQLLATVYPKNATNQTISWSSSDEDIVSIDPLGNITVLRMGAAIITATTEDGGWTDTCIITVLPTPTNGIILNPSSKQMTPEQTLQLTPVFFPTEITTTDLVWESEDEAIATVGSDGLITAKGVGKVVIRVTSGDGTLTAISTITVNPILVSSLKIDDGNKRLLIDNQMQLAVEVKPENATNKGVTWSSSDEKIATIDATGKVNGQAIGTTVITASSKDGSYTTAYLLTVYPIPVASIAINKTSMTLLPNTNEKITATIMPNNATNKVVTWRSSNTKVATVDANGVITTREESGTTTITATSVDGNFSKTCLVTVRIPVKAVIIAPDSTSLDVKGTKSIQLTGVITPINATNKAMTWSSSNTAVATVNSTGLVTAKKDGSVKITVTTADGGHKWFCQIEVGPSRVGAVTMNPKSKTVTVGDKFLVTSTVTPESAINKSITYTSSNLAIATIDGKGNVATKKAGKTTLTVKTNDGGKIATCVLTVKPVVKSTGISFTTVSGNKPNPYYRTLVVHETGTFKTTVKPSDTANPAVTIKTATGKANIISLASTKTPAKFQAKAHGFVKVNASTNDSGGKIKTTAYVSVIKKYAQAKTMYVKVAKNAPQRQGSSTDSAKLQTIARTKKVSVLGVSGNFYQVKYGGKTGFVETKDLSPTKQYLTTGIKFQKGTTNGVLAGEGNEKKVYCYTTYAGNEPNYPVLLSPTKASNKNILWSVSNSKVAKTQKAKSKANSSGKKTFPAKALKPGVTEIYAKTEDTGKTARARLFVVKKKQETKYVLIGHDKSPIRLGPSGKYQKAGTVGQTKKITVKGSINGWYWVNYNGIKGFIHGSHLSSKKQVLTTKVRFVAGANKSEQSNPYYVSMEKGKSQKLTVKYFPFKSATLQETKNSTSNSGIASLKSDKDTNKTDGYSSFTVSAKKEGFVTLTSKTKDTGKTTKALLTVYTSSKERAGYIYKSSGTAQLRIGADNKAPAILNIPANNIVKIVGASGNKWYRVRYSGYFGYIPMSQIRSGWQNKGGKLYYLEFDGTYKKGGTKKDAQGVEYEFDKNGVATINYKGKRGANQQLIIVILAENTPLAALAPTHIMLETRYSITYYENYTQKVAVNRSVNAVMLRNSYFLLGCRVNFRHLRIRGKDVKVERMKNMIYGGHEVQWGWENNNKASYAKWSQKNNSASTHVISGAAGIQIGWVSTANFTW